MAITLIMILHKSFLYLLLKKYLHLRIFPFHKRLHIVDKMWFFEELFTERFFEEQKNGSFMAKRPFWNLWNLNINV